MTYKKKSIKEFAESIACEYSEKITPLNKIIEEENKTKEKKRQAVIFWLVHDQQRAKKSHPNTSQYVSILSGAWPDYRSGNTLAGPARIR